MAKMVEMVKLVVKLVIGFLVPGRVFSAPDG